MNVAQLKEILKDEPDESHIIFEIVGDSASYSIDQVECQKSFVVLKSVD